MEDESPHSSLRLLVTYFLSIFYSSVWFHFPLSLSLSYLLCLFFIIWGHFFFFSFPMSYSYTLHVFTCVWDSKLLNRPLFSLLMFILTRNLLYIVLIHQQLCNVYLRSAVNTSYNRVWFLNQCRTRVRSYSHPWAYRVCLVCSTENQWSLNCRWIWLDAGVSRKWHVLGVTKRGPWAVSHVRMNCWNLSLANL